jgi:hypothetical protein
LSSLGDTKTELDQHEKAALVRSRIEDSKLLEEWDEFSQTRLREVLDHQTMGSYEMPPAEIMNASSQDDPLKLGVDLDVFGDDEPDPQLTQEHLSHSHVDNFTRFSNMTKHHVRLLLVLS